MKKLLIIALLFVGCDQTINKYEVDDEIHPLVGRWNEIKRELYLPSVDVQDYWILNESASYTVGEIHPLTDVDYRYRYRSLEFNIDEVFSYEYCGDTTSEDTIRFEGIYLAKGEKLTLMFDDASVTIDVAYDKIEITNNELTMTLTNNSLEEVDGQYLLEPNSKQIATYIKATTSN